MMHGVDKSFNSATISIYGSGSFYWGLEAARALTSNSGRWSCFCSNSGMGPFYSEVRL